MTIFAVRASTCLAFISFSSVICTTHSRENSTGGSCLLQRDVAMKDVTTNAFSDGHTLDPEAGSIRGKPLAEEERRGIHISANNLPNGAITLKLPDGFQIGGTQIDCEAMKPSGVEEIYGCIVLGNHLAPQGMLGKYVSVATGLLQANHLETVSGMWKTSRNAAVGQMIRDGCITIQHSSSTLDASLSTSQYDSRESFSSELSKSFTLDTGVKFGYGAIASDTQFSMTQSKSSLRTGNYSKSIGQWKFSVIRGSVQNHCIQQCLSADRRSGCIRPYLDDAWLHAWEELADYAETNGYITDVSSKWGALKNLALQSSMLFLKSYSLGAVTGYVATAEIQSSGKEEQQSMSYSMSQALKAKAPASPVTASMSAAYEQSMKSVSSRTRSTFSSRFNYIGPASCHETQQFLLNYSESELRQYMVDCTNVQVSSFLSGVESLDIIFPSTSTMNYVNLKISVANMANYEGDDCGIFSAKEFYGSDYKDFRRGRPGDFLAQSRPVAFHGTAWDKAKGGYWECGPWACYSSGPTGTMSDPSKPPICVLPDSDAQCKGDCLGQIRKPDLGQNQLTHGWTQCFDDETCGGQGGWFRKGDRDICIRRACEANGMTYDSNEWRDCGNWHFQGKCGIWTTCYRNSECNGNRDECIQAECKKMGRIYNGHWRDCGNWYFKGLCV